MIFDDILSNKDRFKDFEWVKPLDIIIGGAGGIGSYTAFFLSRIGHNITIYDFDVIEERNIGGQLYSSNDINEFKVDALKSFCNSYSSNPLNIVNSKYDENSLVSNVMISCFDNMKSRKIMFEKWLNYQMNKIKNNEKKEDEINIFIDSRMGAELTEVYAIDSKSSAKRFKEEDLFDDSEVMDASCTMAATSHCGSLAGILITNTLNTKIVNSINNMEVRSKFYKVQFNLQLMKLDKFV